MKNNKFPIIVLGVLLILGLLIFFKKSSYEDKEDMIQNYAIYSEAMVIEKIKSKLKYLYSNCSTKVKQDAAIINLQKQLIEEIVSNFEMLSAKYQQYNDLFMKNGIIAYGPVKNSIILRFLNPDIVVSNMMITDKINVDKLNNQTYTDKLDIINLVMNDITNNILTTTVVTQPELLNNLKTKMNEVKTKYTDAIVKNFDDMNSINRKISNNLLSLDLSKYGVFMTLNFSNIKSYNRLDYGLNLSDFIDWRIGGKDGTDLNMRDIYLVDMRNGDILDPLDMRVKDSLNNNPNILFEEKNNIILEKIIKDIQTI
jgi:hypothetical protein